MAFEVKIASTAEGQTAKYALYEDARQLSYAAAIQYWQGNQEFRQFFVGLLVDSPYVAYRWETPAVTPATLGRDFEFVLLDYPRLERRWDASTFSQYFDDSDVVTFLQSQALNKHHQKSTSGQLNSSRSQRGKRGKNSPDHCRLPRSSSVRSSWSLRICGKSDAASMASRIS